ncbi:MAG: carboxypeptidase regulatory-like domain-containing protein [Acidobacteria bacterium]|nr:carboxypeptidase regulatory-like domain-containing protein [Acidobacteriota bacterium]
MSKKLLKIGAIAVFLLLAGATCAAAQSGGAKGKVRNSKGDGLAGVEVTARKDGKDIKSVKTDVKGNFQMTGLSSGTYNFVFDKQGYSVGVKYDVEIKSGDIRDLGNRLVLGVDSGTLVLINGSVFDQDGRSITGARVEIVKISGGETSKKLGTAYTNVSGEFTFRQPEGAATFRITATARGVSASKEISVDSAARYRLAITLNLPQEK